MDNKENEIIEINITRYDAQTILDSLEWLHKNGLIHERLETEFIMAKQQIESALNGPDYRHYTDGMIELRFTDALGCGETRAVFVNESGETRVIDTGDNFFGVSDLIDAFKDLAKCYGDEADEKEALDAFKKWLIDCGCDPAEWEDE